MLKKLASRYQALIEYFVPESLRGDRDSLNQARMFLISHTMGPVLGNSVPLALFFFDPTIGFDIPILSLLITAFWVYPFLLKRGFDYDKLVLASVVNLNLCIFWSCYFNGGVLSPTLPWILIIPILSFFYIGGVRRLQARLLGVFVLSFGTFLAFYLTTNPPVQDIPDLALVGLGIVSTVAALCYVATMAIYYARIFDAGVELENEVRRRRAATEELRGAILAADEANHHKAEFLARMSHELKTPLNAVIGYGQILRDEAEDNRDRQTLEDVNRILDAGAYLLRLINIILDLSKIEAGRMQFTVAAHSLGRVLDDAVAAMREQAERAGNTLGVRADAVAHFVETDRQRLLQVIGEILDNAVTHAPGVAVEIGCRPVSTEKGAAYAVTIQDRGAGIDPERLARLFEALADSRDASASRYGGTGLNLTVIKKLAEALGCELGVASTVGEGTCFTLQIPLEWTPAKPVSEPAGTSDRSLAA